MKAPHLSSPSPLRGEGGEGVMERVEGSENELASPACYAHEMDPAYMWAEPRRRAGWLLRLLDRLRRRSQP